MIAADDDWRVKDNPGLFAAIAAARAAHALVAIPKFPDDREDKDTDFADLLNWRDEGQQYIRQNLAKAIEPNAVVERTLADDPLAAWVIAWSRNLPPCKKRIGSFMEADP